MKSMAGQMCNESWFLQKKQLKQKFRAAYDQSFADSLFQNYPMISALALDHLGEGSHFSVFRGRRGVGSPDLVYKFATRDFFNKFSPAGLLRWIETLKKIEQENLILVPPMAFKYDQTLEKLLVVQLFALPGLRHPSLEPSKQAFEAALKIKGLHIDDQLQLGSVQDVPVLLDFSDLAGKNLAR